MMLMERATPFIQPIGLLLAVFFTSTLSYLYGRRSERYKADLGYKLRQKEIRYSKIYDKRLAALEGLNGRMIEITDLCLRFSSPLQEVPLREGMDLAQSQLAQQRERVEVIAQKVTALHEIHRSAYLYLPLDLNEDVKQHNDQLVRSINNYMFYKNENIHHSNFDVWTELEDGVAKAKETRIRIESKFRELLAEVEH